ncbi:MAG: hypothetical protein ACLT4Y_10730 [Bifidobacterium breve]
MTHGCSNTFRALGAIKRNGIKAARRYIISFTKSAQNVRDVQLNPWPSPIRRMCGHRRDPAVTSSSRSANSVDVLGEIIKIPEVQARLRTPAAGWRSCSASPIRRSAGPTTATLALHSAESRIVAWAGRTTST